MGIQMPGERKDTAWTYLLGILSEQAAPGGHLPHRSWATEPRARGIPDHLWETFGGKAESLSPGQSIVFSRPKLLFLKK